MVTLSVLGQFKRLLGQLLGWLTIPFRAIGRFLFSFVLVPGFHLILTIRRQLDRLYLPAKNKILFLFSNRFAIHFAIILIAIFSVFTSFRPAQVQAQEYGQESILSAMLSQDGTNVTTEVTASSSPFVQQPTSYRDTLAFSAPIAENPELATLEGEAGTITNTPSSSGTTSGSTIAKRNKSETYTIEDGDTVSTIAKKFGLSITTVLWSNNLSVRSTIRPGDTLTILPVDGVVHTVKRGDTLGKIANLYNGDSNEIESYNNLASANALSVGQQLIIPGGEQQAPAPTRKVASVSNLFTPEKSTPKGSPERKTIGMIWPTDLHKINTYYGQYYVYGRHTGLDIDCNFNNNNYAAADGIVTSAGWNPGGYGNLVTIDHGNGLVTYYGHHAKLYVRAGQTVTQGTPLGLCGTTGRSTGTHLHFEIRVNGKTVNPLSYLK